MNYLRLDNPDDHQTTDGDILTFPITGWWICGIDQGETASPIKHSACYPTLSGQKTNTVLLPSKLHSPQGTVQFVFKADNEIVKQHQYWEFPAEISKHIKTNKEVHEYT